MSVKIEQNVYCGMTLQETLRLHDRLEPPIAFGKQVLHVSSAEIEAAVEPNGMLDD